MSGKKAYSSQYSYTYPVANATVTQEAVPIRDSTPAAGPAAEPQSETNLGQRLAGGTYGRLLQALKRVRGSFDLKLPKIIVVGQESQGKSSTLERIAGRHVFPQGDSFTTRMPILLMLRNSTGGQNTVKLRIVDKDTRQVQGPWETELDPESADDNFIGTGVERALKAWVESLPAQQQSRGVLSDHELEIEITSPDVPTLDLVDLPGVISDPPEQARRTEEIVKRYLKDQHVLVLAVFSGVENRLRNSVALPLLRQARLENRVVAVLTMTDRDGGTRNLKERIQLDGTDLPSDIGIRQLIPVANGESEQRRGAENGFFTPHETQFFQQWCGKNGLTYHTNQFGIPAVLDALDLMLSSYMKQHWVQSQLRQIAAEKAATDKEFESLGKAPENISMTELRQHIQELLNDVLKGPQVSIPLGEAPFALSKQQRNQAGPFLSLLELMEFPVAPMVLSEARFVRVRHFVQFRQKLELFCDQELSNRLDVHLCQLYQEIFKAAFETKSGKTQTLKISRFTPLAMEISNEAFRRSNIAEIARKTKLAITHIFLSGAQKLSIPFQHEIQSTFVNVLIEEALLDLMTSVDAVCTEGYVLEESEEAQQVRSELMVRRFGLDEAEQALREL